MLRLTDVKKAFTEPDGTTLPILDIAGFEAAAGEQLALVGRSGCGKTTLLHIIAGILLPDSGTVEVDGLDITPLSETQRDAVRAERIGYVFQTFNLLNGFSALENVLLGMSFVNRRAADPRRARELLDRVGLRKRMSHKPSALSVGEQQRVAVARALANRPKVLLADEPTASVDAKHQQQVLDLLCETCRDENVTLILVTHTEDVVKQFSRVEHLEQFNQVASIA
jgi:putative ABC transport system ATP-binding protein